MSLAGATWANRVGCSGGPGCPCCAGAGPWPRVSAPPARDLPLVDTHSHVHQGSSAAASSDGSCTAVLAVDERCWAAVSKMCVDPTTLVPGLGIHPWRVHEISPGWEARLWEALARCPAAIVGEIGLCKCARNLRGPGAKGRVWPLQLSSFRAQLAIASSLGRPASVHCVKAHGTLLDTLRSPPPRWTDAASAAGATPASLDGSLPPAADSLPPAADSLPPAADSLPPAAGSLLPPAIALHSYSGSAEMVRRLRLASQPWPPRDRRAPAVCASAAALPPRRLGAAPLMSSQCVTRMHSQVRQLLSLPGGSARLYFSFSHTVNVAMGGAAEEGKARDALLDAIRAVPQESPCSRRMWLPRSRRVAAV